MNSFFVILAACALANVIAFPAFVQRIPNGGNTEGGTALIAHVKESGGRLNAFGKAFNKAGKQWTKELCQADSDGDGQTNGQELGDPCCVWTSGAVPRLTNSSAPGDATKMGNSTTWTNVTCAQE